jgi:anti-anti-sigma factor
MANLPGGGGNPPRQGLAKRISQRGATPHEDIVHPLNLAVDLVEMDDLVLVRLEGELDLATSAVFRSEVEDRLDPAERQVVLDLAQVELVDSAGLGALLRLGHRAAGGGRRLGLVVGESAMVRRLLRITGLEEAFALGEDLAGARAALAAPTEG